MTTGRETEGAGRHAAVEVIRRGTVAEVIIGNAARHNVLGSAEWVALARTFRELAAHDTIRAVFQAIISHPEAAVRAAKRAVGAGLERAIEAARIVAVAPPFGDNEFREGIAAFLHAEPRAS